MEKIDSFSNINRRILSKGKKFKLIRIGSIFYIIHSILNIITISLGYREPNNAVFVPSYEVNLTNNYLYPWIILSYTPYSNASFIMGIFVILLEITALFFIVLNLIKNYKEQYERINLVACFIFIFYLIFKYFSIFYASYISIEESYTYPENIFRAFRDRNGVNSFIVIFNLIFFIQIIAISILAFIYYQQYKLSKIVLPISVHNFILLFLLLLSFLFTRNISINNSSQIFQTVLNLQNVAPSLEWKGYLKILNLNIVSNSINSFIFLANIVISKIIEKRE